ncbi:MAG: ATP-binding protein, partial [Thermodesulfovibrionales bacterium]
DVFHYSYPFSYSGIDWGWIHIGLSLKGYHTDLRNLYVRTTWLTLFCILVGMAVSLPFARKLSDPIKTLDDVTQRVAAGDLAARVEIRTGDELESLGHSFNRMTEALDRSQGDLVASQEYTDNIITSMNDALIVTNPDGFINKVNRATLDLLGYAEEELIDKPIGAIVIHESQEQERSVLGEGLSELITQGVLRNLETFYISRDGRKIPVLFSGSVMRNAAGDMLGMVCMALDITMRKETEDALRKAKVDAVAANRAKSQFLANMSHEIRTPMNGVLGMIDLLLATRLEFQQRRYAETAHSSAESLLKILNDILDFSKIEAGKLDLEANDFDLPSMVRGVANLLDTRASKKDLQLSYFIEDDVPAVVCGDQLRLKQVLVNLIGNAIKFTDRGIVRVHVAVRGYTDDTVLLFFEITDSGIGISPEGQLFIFDAFSQADASTTRRHEGTGLGLAISKQLVEMMGGEIGFESELRNGSTFWFTVRMKTGGKASAIAAPYILASSRSVSSDWSRNSLSEQSPVQQETAQIDCLVLFAEDNIVNQQVGREMLESMGCRVDVVNNGQQAVELISRRPYDIVFMDCQMPYMDGYEASRVIRAIDGKSVLACDTRHERIQDRGQGDGACELHKHIPIIALTAHAMLGDREACLAAGMDDYISKPFTFGQLRRAVEQWVKVRTADNEAIAEKENSGSSNGHAVERDAGSAGEDIVSMEAETNRLETLDHKTLDRLARLQKEGAPDLVTRILSIYLADSSGLLSRLHKAVTEGSASEIQKAAHSLKSSSANVGAMQLSSLCKRLEAMGRVNSTEGAGELLAGIDAEYRAVESALREELQKRASL